MTPYVFRFLTFTMKGNPMASQTKSIPESVKQIKRRLERVTGHPLEPFWSTGKGVWELRYLNRSGVHLFSVTLRFADGRWAVAAVSNVLIVGDIVEA